MATARYYDESKAEGGSFPGVPLGDISEERWERMPKHLQASVDASPMYRKTPVPRAKPTKAEPAPAKESED